MTEGDGERARGGGGGAHWDKFLSLIKFPPSEAPLSGSKHQHARRYTYKHSTASYNTTRRQSAPLAHFVGNNAGRKEPKARSLTLFC